MLPTTTCKHPDLKGINSETVSFSINIYLLCGCMHTCTHAHMHTCTHAHMHTCTHAHMHTSTRAPTKTRLRAQTHTHAHNTYARTQHIRTHTTHTHAHNTYARTQHTHAHNTHADNIRAHIHMRTYIHMHAHIKQIHAILLRIKCTHLKQNS